MTGEPFNWRDQTTATLHNLLAYLDGLQSSGKDTTNEANLVIDEISRRYTEEGANAHLAGVSQLEVPYDEETSRHRNWMDGWRKAGEAEACDNVSTNKC